LSYGAMSFRFDGCKGTAFFWICKQFGTFFIKKEFVIQMKEELCVPEILRFALNDNILSY